MKNWENLVLVLIICVGLVLCSIFLFRNNIDGQFGNGQRNAIAKYTKNVQPAAFKNVMDSLTSPWKVRDPYGPKPFSGNIYPVAAATTPTAPDAVTSATPRIISWANSIITKTKPAIVGICVGDTNQASPWMQGWEIVTPTGLRSVGSGIVINPKGYVLTNYHVIAVGGKITVSVFTSRAVGTTKVQQYYRDFPAEVIATEKKNDLALLKIIATREFVSSLIGDSDMVKVGDKVIGIGNPFGLTQTVTSGIVSAKRKRLPIGGIVLENVLQLDVPINPGNSGGALVNVFGEVIGINTAIYSPVDSIYTGVSFAIPINQAKALFKKYFFLSVKPVNFQFSQALQPVPQQENPVMPQTNNNAVVGGNNTEPPLVPLTAEPETLPPFLPANAKLIQPSPGEGIEELAWLGIDLVPESDVNTAISAVEVDEIEGITPMEAGLQAGDIIKSINGYPTSNMYELIETIKKVPLKSGQGIVLDVFRPSSNQYMYISFRLHKYDLRGR